MLPDIVGGLISLIQDELGVESYDGEIPRRDENDVDLDEDAFPVYRVEMVESGFNSEPSFEDGIGEAGPVLVQIYGSSREQIWEPFLALASLLYNSTKWPLIDLGDPQMYVSKMLRTTWWCGQEKGVRTRNGGLLYRGDIYLDIDIQAGEPTRGP